MKQFVLDCSISISWYLSDESNSYADRTLSLLQSNFGTVEAVVPEIWSLEVANTFLVSMRRQRMTAIQVTTAIDNIESLAILVDRLTAQSAFKATLELGRDYNLAAYDAAYLELAIRRGLPIATIDNRLIEAAFLLWCVSRRPNSRKLALTIERCGCPLHFSSPLAYLIFPRANEVK